MLRACWESVRRCSAVSMLRKELLLLKMGPIIISSSGAPFFHMYSAPHMMPMESLRMTGRSRRTCSPVA